MSRLLRICIILSVLLLAVAYFLRPEGSVQPPERSYGKAAIGGAFEAVNHLNEPISDADLKGHYSLLYFGFTYCPDICPAGLSVIANALDALPEATRAQLLPIFVTVDPERDSPDVMKDYIANFHAKLIGITGTPEQMATIAKAYKVYFNRAPNEENPEEYLVDHSGYMYLMSPEGEYITHFPHNVTTDALVASLNKHIQ